MHHADSPSGTLNPQALADVQARIAAAQARSPNAAPEVTMVAVTKAFPVSTMISAFEGGLHTLGESRVQEGEIKVPQFPHRDECEIRLIGHLQSNKVRKAMQLFDLIESVDSIKLFERLDRIASEEDRKGYPIYLQVNAGHDQAKFGFHPEEVLQVLDEVEARPHLQIRGIMTIAPYTDEETIIRDCFKTARGIWDKAQERIPACKDLSMGMSGDFELAVEEGATHVRIGRALFGERPIKPQ